MLIRKRKRKFGQVECGRWKLEGGRAFLSGSSYTNLEGYGWEY